MNLDVSTLLVILPEVVVLTAACVVLLGSVFLPEAHRSGALYWFTQLGLAGAFLLVAALFHHPNALIFHDSFTLDAFAVLLKLGVYLVAALSLAYVKSYVDAYQLPAGEFYALSLFSVVGMSTLISASSLLTLFLGLELFSLPLYALVAIRRDSPACTEAAIKYFVMGALATGMLLYGFSMLYGVAHSFSLPVIAQTTLQLVSQHQDMTALFGLVFVVVGLAFKLGAVPFHMWVPDVYAGAPTPVTAFIASAAKLAAFGLLIRVLVDAVPALADQWRSLVIVLCALSIAVGNIAAVMQTEIKRLLAYSAIAHMGYMLLGVLVASQVGYAAALFYVLTYGLMTVGAFGILLLLQREKTEVVLIEDLSGLSRQHPWFAFLMLIIMFSMAGIPPFVGFMGKVGVLEALVSVKLVWLAVFAMLFALVGAYYYIRVIRVMYFGGGGEADDAGWVANAGWSKGQQMLLSVNCLAVLVLGVFPGALFALCRSVL